MEGFTTDLSTSSVETAVIGGGLAGLVVAHELKKHKHHVWVFEKTERAGGMVRSVNEAGYLLELGPNTVAIHPELMELIRDLNLESETLIASLKTPRFIQRQGRLYAVPLSPPALLTTPLLSFAGKIRALREPWIAPRNDDADESLRDFAERRFGSEVANRLLAPFVAGVWAGELSSLSAPAAFPALVAAERERGSVLKGLLRRKKKPSPRGLLSFKNGLRTLVTALERQLADDLRRSTAPTALARDGHRWKIETPAGTVTADRVVLAAPAIATAELILAIDREAAFALAALRYAPVTVVHLGFKADDLKKSERGFGYLTLPDEHPDILGCVWSSDIFPGRAPEGHVLLTVFVGGSLNPAMAAEPDDSLVKRVLAALNTVLSAQTPSFQRITRHKNAIPQYTLGHLKRMEALEKAERKNPGLYFVGNVRGGISVGDVIRSSKTCAAHLI
jgi:oxygen-dependent protoporphyrinogen oxidase